MVKIEAVLHPEEAELVWTMLNHAATQLTRGSTPATVDDSAESGVAAQTPTVEVTPDPAACRSDDSAESPRRRQPKPMSRLGHRVMSEAATITIPRNRRE